MHTKKQFSVCLILIGLGVCRAQEVRPANPDDESVQSEDEFRPVHPLGNSPLERSVALGHTTHLPNCDRVDVYTLELKPFGNDENEKLPNDQSFPIRPYDAKARIIEKMTASGDEARRICHAWRDLTFDAGSGAFCHMPMYGLRFYRNDRLLFETSVSWNCQNFFIPNVAPHDPLTVGPPREHRWYGFRSDPKLERLLRLLSKHIKHPNEKRLKSKERPIEPSSDK